MKIESTRFGSLEVNPDKIIQFPAGMPGFEDCREFTLLELEQDRAEGPGVAVLQCVNRPEIAFSVTVPDLVGLHYEFTLTEDEEQVLRLHDPKDIAVLLILRREDGEDNTGVKANLMAPLVINIESRVGFQKVIGKLGCDITLKATD